MFIGFDQIVVAGNVLSRSCLNIPANANRAVLQCGANGVRYTCDGKTIPTTSRGMLLKPTDLPYDMLIEDLLRIQFIQDGGSASELHIHYSGSHDSFPPTS